MSNQSKTVEGMTTLQARVFELREKGRTNSEIARLLKISVSSASELHRKAKLKIDRYRNRAENPFWGLSVRAVNALLWNDLNTRDQILAALRSGVISEKCKIRNLGRHTYIEICKWAGVEPVLSGTRHWKFDPFTGKPPQVVAKTLPLKTQILRPAK